VASPVSLDPTPPRGIAPRSRPVRHRLLAVVAVAVLALVASACELRLTEPPGDSPLRYRDQIFSAVTVTNGITYGSAVSQTGITQTLQLDMYRPTGDTVTGRPAIIWVHGGSFKFGSRTSPEIVDQANTFTKLGYVNLSISYRLSTNGCTVVTAECLEAIIDAREDAQAAVRFLRANSATYGVDPDRIAIAGTSAGAITALNVAYGSETPGDSGTPGVSSTVRSAVSLSGARILTQSDAGEPPVLLFHGTADPLVPFSSAQSTVDTAHAAGLTAEMTVWEGEGHVPYGAHRTEILDQTRNFLYWVMDLPHAPV
jgi:acetyl esterase/lipase